MKIRPPVRGTTTVDIHSPATSPALAPSSSLDRPGRIDVWAPTTTLARYHPEPGRARPDVNPDAIAPAPPLTVHELPTAATLPSPRAQTAIESYWIATGARLPEADAQGFRTLKGRPYVDVPDGGIVQIGIDPLTGLYRARLHSELTPSGPVLVRDADSALWHPRPDLESIIFTLSETRLEAFRTTLDFAYVEVDGDGLIRHEGKLYVVIHERTYQVLHDQEASSPHAAVMRIIWTQDPVARDPDNVYVATRPGRSEAIVFDPRDGWVGVNVAGTGGMRRGEPERPVRQSLAERLAAFVNRPKRLEPRVRKLFPSFDDQQVATWLQWFGDTASAALTRKEAEYKTLKKDLLAWIESGAQTSSASEVKAKLIADEIKRCWRHETAARLILSAEGISLPVLSADFRHVRVLTLSGVNGSAAAETFLSGFSDLRSLSIKHSSLEKLPAPVADMRKLTRLDLSSNHIELDQQDAARLAGLNQLIALDLSHNPLNNTPDFSGMTGLNSLDLSHTGITHWPTGLEEMSALTDLNLSHNALREVPQAFINPAAERLASVARINSVTHLAGNDFPPGYWREFDSYWRRLNREHPELIKTTRPTAFDTEDSGVQRYRRLYPGKSIKACRDFIWSIEQDAAGIRLNNLEQEFSMLKGQLDAWVFSGGGIRQRYIRANQLQINAQNRNDRTEASNRILACWRRETPQKLANDQTPIGLELDLSGLNLPSLPDIDVDFSHVGSLKLSNMSLSTSPEGFLTRFRHVRWLDLSRNQLRELPPAVGEMHGLTRLFLQDNQIALTAESAQVLAGRSTLRALWLNDNPHLAITPDFSQILDMRSLNLASTGIDAFPTGLVDQPLLDTVNLRHNRITEIHDAVIAPPDERLAHTARVNNVTDIGRNPLSAETLTRLNRYNERLIEAETPLTGRNNLIDSARGRGPAVVRAMADDPMARWTAGLSADEVSARRTQWQTLRDQQGSDGLFDTLERLLQDPAGHQALQQRVWKVIDSITENSPESERLRRELFSRAGEATCCDRAAFTFANLEVRTMMYNARTQARDQAQGPELSALSKALFRLHEVDKIASADIARREAAISETRGTQAGAAHVQEEVEIRLAYRHGLKDRLQLPGQPERMGFAQLANVSKAQLDAAYEKVIALDNSPEEFQALISREFWQEFVTHKYRSQFESQRQPFQDRQSTLDDAHNAKTLAFADYDEQSRALQASLAIEEAALVETLTRQELSEQAARSTDEQATREAE